MDPKELRKQYLEMAKMLGLPPGMPVLTNDEGKIILGGRRWILMDVEAFPQYMIEVVSKLVGERLAQEFIYWFGVAYGEKVVERFQRMGFAPDLMPLAVAVMASVFAGWCIAEIVEYEPEEGRAAVKIYYDFESESAALNRAKPTNNFLRGVVAGIMSRISQSRVYATAEYKDDHVLITVRKR